MRMKRVIDPAGVSIICALDHGMTSPQFLEPLADISTRTAEAVAGGANVIMMSKGMIRIAAPAFAPTTSLALLLSASSNPDRREPEVVQIAEVDEAARLGAGSRLDDSELLGRMESAMSAGAIGCSVGRNIFMHRSPAAITRALSSVIRERNTARDALAALQRELGTVAAR